MNIRHLVSTLIAVTASVTQIFGAAGPILMVHGHADNPALWTIQGSALAQASSGTRFYDSTWYYANQLPQGGFKSNGIYGVTYYSRTGPGPWEPAPISPVRLGSFELPPDDPNLTAFLHLQPDSYALRLSNVIHHAYAQSGQRVTLVCHSMGGLVSLSTVAWFGTSNKVEKIVTIGSPLRGFPPDFRVPSEIIGLDRTGLFREGLQMSEGVTYDGQSFSAMLEARFKRFKPPTLSVVNIVGTLSPFPRGFLVAINESDPNDDGVVRSMDQRFRDPSLATVYELPLAHNEDFKVVRYAGEDVESLSTRTTHVLEKEVLGLNPLPRLTTALSFNYSTARIRVTVRNDGGLPVAFTGTSGRFEFLGSQGRIATDPLSGLVGQTLQPSQTLTVDSLPLQRGEHGDVRLALTMNGRELPPGEPTFIANIQAPEIEASIRYDFANSILRNEWDTHGGNQVRGMSWFARYRLEGTTLFDSVSNRLKGSMTACIFPTSTGNAAVATNEAICAESFSFDLDLASLVFTETGGTSLGKTPLLMDDATGSRLRELYRTKLVPMASQPGPFVIEGTFSAVAGVRMDRPVFQQDSETHGLALNLNGALLFTFSDNGSDTLIELPFQASCSSTFVNDKRGLVMRPRVRKLSLTGFSLSENYRRQINKMIEANELVLVPASFTASLNTSINDAFAGTLGPNALPPGFSIFDTITVALDADSSRFRILIDVFDDAKDDGANYYSGVPENGIAFQDRLLNTVLARTRPYLNSALRRSGVNQVPIDVEITIPATSFYYDVPVYGPLSVGGGLDSLRYYLDYVRVNIANDPGRDLGLQFLGPNNRTHFDIPINADFENQLRFYFGVRVGIPTWLGFFGYTRRFEAPELRQPRRETLAVDIDGSVYPYLREATSIGTDPMTEQTYTNRDSFLGVRFPPRELSIDVRFNDSTPIFGILGEFVAEPVFNLARDNPEKFGIVGGALGGLFGGLFPKQLAGAAGSAAGAQIIGSGGNSDTNSSASRLKKDTAITGLGINANDPPVSDDFRPVMAWAGFAAGAIAGQQIGQQAADAFKPRTEETLIPLPPGIRLTNLTIAARAASIAIDLDPSFGDLSVVAIAGLDATNGIVPLSRDDLGFDYDAKSFFGLVYNAGGESRPFTSLWIRKPVSKIRLSFRYEASFLGRYNTGGFPDYTVEYKPLENLLFDRPLSYLYEGLTDTATFHADVPLLEGGSSMHAVRLRLPGQQRVLPFLVGKDTSPILINAPFASYSGVSSNVTIRGGSLVYRNNQAPQPGFVLEALRLIDLRGNVTVTDLKPLAPVTQSNYTPADTRTERLYGVDFSWIGRLPSTQFPEGLYAVQFTIRETSLDRKGSILIPLLIDRTPPEIVVRPANPEPVFVSRHLNLPLLWNLSDQFSAVMHDVDLTYSKSGGPVLPGAVFAKAGKVLTSGQRRFDFAPDLSTVPDGVEDLYTLQIQATDVPGNRGVSSNLQFMVDTRPPSLGSVTLYPTATAGPYHAIINQSNRLLTVKVQSHEPVTARFILVDGTGSTNAWIAQSSPVAGGGGAHQAIWILELPSTDTQQGLLEGVVAEGVHRLSLELVDRASNTNFFPNLRTILVDRTPPELSFASQQTFLPVGRTTYPLGLNAVLSEITSIALVDLNSYSPTTAVPVLTLKTWTGSQTVSLLQTGVPLDLGLLGRGASGTYLPPGHYGVEVKARDAAGNESRIATRFGFQFIPPHVEALGAPKVSGIVPILGVAVDPDPSDRHPFRVRELYWKLGANQPPPGNLTNLTGWNKSGLYVMPPRGVAFAGQDNMSSEMVTDGTLAYWNTTLVPITLEGDQQPTIPGANLQNSDVTLLLVVRDQAGRAWSHSSSVRVDNRQLDLNSVNAPGVQILSSAVNNRQLQVEAALLRDAPALQMLVLDAKGAGVFQTASNNVLTRNALFGTPTYSPLNDFGFFLWYDEALGQLTVRCLSPLRNSLGQTLSKGHTFYFSLRGEFSTNDLSYQDLEANELPGVSQRVVTSTNGVTRVTFALFVPPGSEKGVTIDYHGGRIAFSALGLDEYLQVLYENRVHNPPMVEKYFWRTDDPNSVFPGYLAMSKVRNLVGLEGSVHNGFNVETLDPRAVANHGGALGHIFVGRGRTEPISPLDIVFDSPVIRPDLTLTWNLKLPNGAYAEPGPYQVQLYTIDAQGNRFYGARSALTLSPADVPFTLNGLRLSSPGSFNPLNDGGLSLNFNVSRTNLATIQILNAANQVVATLADRQFIEGRTDTNSPHQVWWDGYINGEPAVAGNYRFQLILFADGVSRTNENSLFTVSYPANKPRDSDWGLLTQPIAFDPDARDRITRDPANQANDRAWVTLRFDARLADGSLSDAETQVRLRRVATGFQSDTNANNTHIPISPLFRDAVVNLENVRVKFNDRVVDAFPSVNLPTVVLSNEIPSRASQFNLQVFDLGPKALRLKVVLKARLKPVPDLALAVTEFNELFDRNKVREFSTDLEFREEPRGSGLLVSVPWNLQYRERLWGYGNNFSGVLVAQYADTVIDQLEGLEIRDRSGQVTLASFVASEIRLGGASAVGQLFSVAGFTNHFSTTNVLLDFILQTRMDQLQAKATAMGKPVTFGYAAVDLSLRIPNSTPITDDLDPFPTRYYRTGATNQHAGRSYDNVKAYAGDSGLVQEIGFSSNRIAGHVPFQYSIRPTHDGSKGQQTIQAHPWVPYSFRKDPGGEWTVEANQSGADFGWCVASAGDVNGDGYADVIVGAHNFDNGQDAEGRAYVYQGGPNGLAAAPAWTAEGDQAVAIFGYSVATAGDVNGDGYADVIVGAPYYDNGQSDEGRAFVYLGSPNGLSAIPAWTAEVNQFASFGWSVASAGDVNGDGYADVVVGAPRYANEGRAFLYLGGAAGLSGMPAWSAGANMAGGQIGNCVGSAGDVNADGYADVIVGSLSRAFLYLGGPNGLSATPAWTAEGNQANAGFSESVATAGDVNGDGYADVIVGSPNYSNGQLYEGAAFLYLGGPNGLSTTPAWTVEANLASSYFGWCVASAGDVNGDGYADVVVGTVISNDQNLEGRAFLYLGGPNGLSATPAWTAEGNQADARFGISVATAGDVNGDGYADMILGSPSYDNGQINEGQVHVYLGPRTTTYLQGWTCGGPSGGGAINVPRPMQVSANLLPSPVGNMVTTLRYEPAAMQFVTVGNPGNSNDVTTGFGAVAYPFAIGKHEVTLDHYAAFLNAVAATDPYGLYHPSMATDLNSRGISRSGSPGSYTYAVLGSRNRPVTYVSWFDAARFANWMHNRRPIGAQSATTTEDGAYTLNGATSGTGSVKNSGARYWIPSENEWYKAAYHQPSTQGGDSDNYWLYPTRSNTTPNSRNGSGTDANSANIHRIDGLANGFNDGYAVSGTPGYSGAQQYLTPVGAFRQARSFYGTFDQGGSVWEWNDSVFDNMVNRGFRGGSWGDGADGATLLPTYRNAGAPTVEDASHGFRLSSIANATPDGSLAAHNRISVTYSNAGLSGYTTNAPWPVTPAAAAAWVAANSFTAEQIASTAVPLDANGQTNTAYANYLLNPKFAASTADMFIAATPDAYDVVVTNGLIDYEHDLTGDPNYKPTVDYLSGQTVWNLLAPRLPGYPNFAGLPAVRTSAAERPRVVIANLDLQHDPSFPTIGVNDLNLGFSEDPSPDGGEHAFVKSTFSHAATGFFRPWSLAEDPNIKAAAVVVPETVRVTFVLTNYVFATNGGQVASLPIPRLLLNSVLLTVAAGGSAITQLTASLTEVDVLFRRFLAADIAVLITRDSAYSAAGETESLHVANLSLTNGSTGFTLRSTRYQCTVAPVISGAGSNTLSFLLSLRLDPPIEFSTRQPIRRNDRVTLPLKVIDREKFWQVDSGELSANLFQSAGIKGLGTNQTAGAGYVIDGVAGFTQTFGRGLLATDPDYTNKANALFWKTSDGRVIKNPRIILGDLTVALKDPSNQEEPALFQNKRYVVPTNNAYFNDLYVAESDLATLSWKVKIRPQAKEHAYIKVYGSVGGRWTLSYRKKETGRVSGLLAADAGSLVWSSIASGVGGTNGQNQFLTYWDITELNGPHILRMESAKSPDNVHPVPEIQYQEVVLGQHLAGSNNPIFSPTGAITASLFSMHGRTQLTSAPQDRQPDDLFFTVNPMKIEERPFSLGTNGTIPLGERVQVLPHTEHNPLTVNFYIDQQEYSLYDQFRLYHQLEDGQLVQITSLPPSERPKYTLIQGYVEHTSIVGFLPNPSLRLCALDIPGLSRDGVIRVAGAVDLYGTDANGVKNENLTVAIIVSPTNDFYRGQVKARLTTGSKAEFPISTEASLALIQTSWTSGQPPATFHVYAVVVSTNDDWLTVNRPIAQADRDAHLFNVSHTAVTMTTNINNSLTITNVGGLNVFSPNGDGIADTIGFQLDFKRAGLAVLEFRDQTGQLLHVQTVSLNTNGLAGLTWDGTFTGLGTLRPAPDGFYTITARHSDGHDTDTASVLVEVRTVSKYSGQLISFGITNSTGNWRTLWNHQGGVIHSNDLSRLQISDTLNFAIVRADRVITRAELDPAAIFDDTPASLAIFPVDGSGRVTLHYRVRVTDAVGNIGYSIVASTNLPSSGRLEIASVSPLNGATNVTTEPKLLISLASDSPFTSVELDKMFQIVPPIPRSLALSADRRTITVTPGAPLNPGIPVTPSMQLHPGAVGSNIFAWSFRILPTNLVSRTLLARLVAIPLSLDELGAQATAFVVVTNRGNVPARLTISPGTPSTNVFVVTATNAPVLLFPSNEVAIPLSLSVTGQYRGTVSIPLIVREQSIGAVTSLVMNVSVSSITSAPTLMVFSPSVHPSNAFQTSFAGRSRGDGTISTMARMNGGSWWVVSQQEFWSFGASFTSDGDVLEILAHNEQSQASAIYSYTFAGPPLSVAIQNNQSLTWDSQLGRTYAIEWSTNLQSWATLVGDAQRTGATVTVSPGGNLVQIVDAPVGRISVHFTPSHAATTSTNLFFRIRSNR